MAMNAHTESPYGNPERMELTVGPVSIASGSATSSGCAACVSSPLKRGCCGFAAEFSLADLGLALLEGDHAFVEAVLQKGEPRWEGRDWKTRKVRQKCRFHSREEGCTLSFRRRPLFCRTFLCGPTLLMPAARVAEYTAYREAVAALEQRIAERMVAAGVRLGRSSLSEIEAAAHIAFAAEGQAILVRPEGGRSD